MRRTATLLTTLTTVLGLTIVALTAVVWWWAATHPIPTEESTLDEKQ